MKKLLTLAIVLSAWLISTSAVMAATVHYVNPGDNIQAVIDTADPGDTIVFDVGTYSLSATLIVNKPLTLTSADPHAATKPIIDGGGTLDRIIYIDADDVTIDGLEVANGTGDLVCQSNSHSGTTIRNCVIHDSSGDEGIQLKACTNCLVECNVVYNVAQDGISIAGGSHNSVIRNNEIYNSYSENGAIYVYDSYDMTVEGNHIHDTQAANGVMFYKNYGSTHAIINNLIVRNRWEGGKHCYDEADGNAINIYKPRVSSTYLVKHNTLDDNTPVNDCAKPGNAIYVKKSADGVVMNVDDNIVTNHRGYGIRTWSGASVNYGYNDLWQNTLDATDGNPVDGDGNISADPLYNSDYMLGGGSPCIGAASDGKDMGRLFDECECASSAIGDYVWHDVNRDGIQDGGESGINGVVVELYKDGSLLQTTTTANAPVTGKPGWYIFTGLAAGNYIVKVADSNFDSGGALYDYLPAVPNAGTDDTVDSDGDPITHEAAVTLASGENNMTIDFGFSDCEIGDRVWHDETGQGDQGINPFTSQPEPGFNDVHVYLYDYPPTTLHSAHCCRG